MKVLLHELRSLERPRLDIEFHETLEGTQAVKPVVGDIVVTGSSTGMRMTGRVQTLLKLNCDRCLRPYFQPIVIDIDERFVIAGLEDEPKTNTRERELSAHDFFETLPEDNSLDINDIVYQAVTLATPTTHFCGDQCPGPPTPTQSGKGQSLNHRKDARKAENKIDPRWQNLKSLFPNSDSETKS